MEFEVRNCLDDAAEQGPRYSDGGRTRETGLCGGLDWRFPMLLTLSVTRGRGERVEKDQHRTTDEGKRERVALICPNICYIPNVLFQIPKGPLRRKRMMRTPGSGAASGLAT